MVHRPRSLRIAVLAALIPAMACNLSPQAASPTVAGLFSTPSPSVEPYFPDPQREAYQALAAASTSPPQVDIAFGFPRSVVAAPPLEGDTPAEQALAFLERYQDLYRLRSPDLALGVEDVREGPLTVVTLFQTYRGLPVYGGELTVAIAPDGGLTTIGDLLTAGVDLDVAPGLTENEALDLARAHLGAPTAQRAGPAQLVIYDPLLLGGPAPDPRLAWQLRLTAGEPWELFVDAHSGAILASSSLLDRFPGGHSSDWDLDLEDANGNNIQNSGCYWWTSDDDEIGDTDGVYEEFGSNQTYWAMWQGAREAFSFYHGFGRHSFDGDNVEVEFYVDADLPGNTIAWTAVSSDCDAVDYDTDDYPVSDAVVTHEFTHGVIEYTSDFSNSGQPDALDEAYADIMGIWDTKDWTFDGLVDESNLSGHFDDYDPSADEHDNGRIFVTAFSYIVKGVKFGDLVDIDGFNLGDSRVGTLFYLTMIYLNSSSSFLDARNLTLALAPQVGFNPGEVCDIQNAFYATGIGFPDFNCNGIPDNPDKDGDSIDDTFDNCPGVFNGGQEDTDGDGDGDACDNDLDGDGVPNTQDNCLDVPNADQENKDLDFLGKACDPDEDEDFDDDGVLNEFDNCAFDPNPDQADVDSDGDGDACDPDTDGDGISNDDDNCPFTPNPDQANADGDGAGDACDACSGASDVIAWTTGIPELGIDPQPFVPDSDADGIPDACDRTPYLNGQPWTTGVDDILPGGPTLPGEAEGAPGAFVALPLPICPPGNGSAHQESDRQRLLLTGLSDQVRAWVSDGGGDPVKGAPGPGDTRTINFQPQGGEAYWLNLQFAPDFPLGESEQFDLALFCESRDQQERWTPTPTASATSTRTPTPTASATPTPTPTVYVRPSLTPTPTPRRG